MKKQKSKSAAQKRKAKAKMKAREEDKNRPNWVQDRLDWVEVAEYYSEYEHHESDIDDKKTEEYRPQCASDEGSGSDDSEDDPRFNVSIVSWNVLADSYCSRSSHKNLPSKSQSRVFNRNQRQHQVRQILRLFDEKLSPDLVALQEVDPPLEVAKCMKSLGYGVVETVSSPGGRVGRVDSCGLYFREETWNCLNHETVFLDDLAILRSATDCDDKRNDNTKKSNPSVQSKSSNSGSLKGLERSFVRKNVALLTRLVHERTKQEIIVVVAHLFWNPSYEYVKLCQAHYIAKRAIHFRGEDATVPILWCGDFNSQPNGHVHQYITKGVVNAKEAAPWYKLSRKQSKNNSDLSREAFGRLSISERKNPTIADEQEEHPVQVRYLLDYTLNRFCRWLRILGIDAALETEEEERERTKDGKISIFQRCKEEKRSLVTTASKLLNRKDCPPGTYLLDTKSLLNLESAIVHMLLSHGVVLEPKNTLSRCVVCNGSIEPVNDEEKKQKIFRTYQAPEEINDEIMDVYQCNGCSQGYWWCEKPTSSASRVKSQAQRLLELCIMGGVPFKGDLGMFDYIDVDGLRNRRDTGKNCEDQLQVIRWLQSEYLRNPLQNMTSAYAARETGEEMLQFTNVTYDFVGHLDYILYPSKEMEVTNLLYVPDSFQALNDLNVSNGHLLPSFDWPSDHLAIGCCLSLRQSGQNHGANSIEQTSVDPKADNVFQESTGQSNQNFQVLSHHDGHHHEHQDGHHSDILGEDNHDSSQDHHRVHQHDQQRDHLHDHNSAQDLRSSGHHDHRHEKECHHHHDHSTADSHDKSHDHHHDHQHNQQQDHHHNDNSAHNHSHNHGGSHDHQHDHHHGHNHDSGHDHQHDHHHGHIHDSGHDHQHDHHHGHNHDSGHDHQHDHHHGHNHDSGHDHQHDHHHDTNGAASNNRVERCTFFDGPKGPAPFPPGPPSSPPWCSFIASDAKPREPPQKLGTSPDPNGSNESKSSALPEGGCMMVNGICVCYGMGCLPKTPSLFEMAELRRQYRLKLQNGG